MGGTPIMARAILGIPIDKLPSEMAAEILAGGSAVCAAASISVAGGHSIDSPEPIYGLAVIGTCKEQDIRRNAEARTGDAIILTKPLGVNRLISMVMMSKGDLTAPKSNFRSAPESGLRVDIAPFPFCAISRHPFLELRPSGLPSFTPWVDV
jgi:selenium donor protein